MSDIQADANADEKPEQSPPQGSYFTNCIFGYGLPTLFTQAHDDGSMFVTMDRCAIISVDEYEELRQAAGLVEFHSNLALYRQDDGNGVFDLIGGRTDWMPPHQIQEIGDRTDEDADKDRA